MNRPFSLLMFTADTTIIREATAAGVSGIIVDCEYKGKEARQSGYDTQINRHTMQDVRRARQATDKTLIVRINNAREATRREAEEAVANGADEILLPMVRSVSEVEALLDQVNGRCGVGVMIECQAAIEIRERLAQLPLSRVYIGLNDLSIDRRAPNIFTALADGTVDCIRETFDIPVGFAALTLPERGHPIPCRLLIAELRRSRASFSILRRAFFADIAGKEMRVEIPRLYDALDAAGRRNAFQVAQDRAELEAAIAVFPNSPSASPGLRERANDYAKRVASNLTHFLTATWGMNEITQWMISKHGV